VLLALVVIGAATAVAVGYVRHRGEERRARLDEAERGRATRSQQVAAIPKYEEGEAEIHDPESKIVACVTLEDER
jgi:hypothetical protein